MHKLDNYDPWEHAAHLGFTIERGTLSSTNHDAETYLDARLILVRPDLDWRGTRGAIAHENVHIEYGDRPVTHPLEHSRREARCDRIAAERLIDPAKLARIMLENSDPGTWCTELGVTARLLRTYLRRHPELTRTPA